MVFKKATPFSPGARKVLTFSPVKKNRCCIRISFFISHAILWFVINLWRNGFVARTLCGLKKIAAPFVECRISSEFLYEKLSLICTRNILWAKQFWVFVWETAFYNKLLFAHAQSSYYSLVQRSWLYLAKGKMFLSNKNIVGKNPTFKCTLCGCRLCLSCCCVLC